MRTKTGLCLLLWSTGLMASAPRAAAASFEVRVASSSDDAEESASGGVSITSSDLELVYGGSNQVVGMRFLGIAVPQGSTVSSAWIQFQADETQSETTTLSIQAEAADNAPTFSKVSRSISTRPRTSASAAWSPPAWPTVGVAGPDQRTPNIAAVVQEVVSRPGWSVGNALVLIVSGAGHRTAESYDGVAAAAPLLHVDYTPGAVNQPPVVAIAGPQDQAAFDQGAPIAFAGSASDFEEGDLSAGLSWTSNLDGTLGSGASLTRSDLSVGVHTITASVTDGAGATTASSITVEVASGDPVLVGAGDISNCSNDNDEATAQLLDAIPGTVITLGDNAYEDGSNADFANCYEPTWGRHKWRTSPALGNHEYHTPGASGYFAYFGAAAGDPTKGYYSYDLGTWHVIVLNSECAEVGGCQRTSPQGLWLEADLQANPSLCTVAYWHKPRFSSGFHGNNSSSVDFWQLLYDNGVDLVLNGHDHDYERFAPQDPNGNANPSRGIREFVAGTGGASLASLNPLIANSEVRYSGFGVLKLTLLATGYRWRFIPVAGATFTDSGSGDCLEADPLNQAPTVSAGPDQSVDLANGATLEGAVADDGLPNPPGAVTTTWSQVSGPGTASFVDASAVDTSVTFSSGGSYVLRLTASDGDLIAFDEVLIVVTAPNLPGVFEARVVAGSDDAEERASDGKVSRASSDLELIFDKADQVVGMRFTGVPIPQGAMISEAWIQFTTDEVKTGDTSLTISAQAADNATTFTSTARNISSRPRTTSSANWSPPAWAKVGEAGVNQRTPSLAAVVREVVNRPNWASGNAMAFIVTGSGVRTADSFEGGPTVAPLLHVEYLGP